MSEHRATIKWTSNASPDDFTKGKYSREHAWTFDGGVTVPASASPSVVPAPWSNPAGVDPEEAFVASISSCHMLTFLYVAQKAGFVVESYEDQAVGVMSHGERGGTSWVSHVRLSPKIAWGGAKRPTAADEEHLHHEAHEQCFISQSVKTEITVKRQA
jgi:organic hydroperoxide reductase OsmC/OhrA